MAVVGLDTTIHRVWWPIIYNANGGGTVVDEPPLGSALYGDTNSCSGSKELKLYRRSWKIKPQITDDLIGFLTTRRQQWNGNSRFPGQLVLQVLLPHTEVEDEWKTSIICWCDIFLSLKLVSLLSLNLSFSPSQQCVFQCWALSWQLLPPGLHSVDDAGVSLSESFHFFCKSVSRAAGEELDFSPRHFVPNQWNNVPETSDWNSLEPTLIRIT